MIRVMNGGSRDIIMCNSFGGYGNRLFYTNVTGIAYLDTSALTLVDTSTKLYEADVMQVYTFKTAKTNGYNLRTSGSALVCSYRQRDNYADTGLACIDMDSLATRWVTPNNCCYDQFNILGYGVYSPLIAYDDGTESNWAYRFRGFSLVDGSLLGSFDSNAYAECPPIKYKDTVIQASSQNNPGNGLAGKPMLFCLYADSLKLKWRVDFSDDLYWSGSNCAVGGEILYQPFSNGIRLFDVESGEYIGLDENIRACGGSNRSVSLQYKDLLIVNDGYGGKLLGIRMNFKKTAAGLVKE